MILLLMSVVVLALVGAGLLAAMMRRDEPALGVAGMALMVTAGVASSVYGVLTSI